MYFSFTPILSGSNLQWLRFKFILSTCHLFYAKKGTDILAVQKTWSRMTKELPEINVSVIVQCEAFSNQNIDKVTGDDSTLQFYIHCQTKTPSMIMLSVRKVYDPSRDCFWPCNWNHVWWVSTGRRQKNNFNPLQERDRRQNDYCLRIWKTSKKAFMKIYCLGMRK